MNPTACSLGAHVLPEGVDPFASCHGTETVVNALESWPAAQGHTQLLTTVANTLCFEVYYRYDRIR